MLVTPVPYGRMGNRLTIAAHFLCHVEMRGGVYWHPAFAPYNRYFEGTHGRLTLRYVSSRGPRVEGAAPRRRLLAVKNEMFGLDRGGGDVRMDEEPFLALERSARILVCAAWAFRDRTAVRVCAETARRFFRVRPRWRDPAARCVDAARRGADLLAGVHLRLTDYAAFNDGAFFYDHALYRRRMEELAALLPGRTRFLLVSDAALPEAAFAGLDWVPGPLHPVSAQAALSMCDLIVGPPSTFSAWASYMGVVPRLQLKSREQPVRLEDFRAQDGAMPQRWPVARK